MSNDSDRLDAALARIGALEAQLALLADRSAIREVHSRYCRGIDRHDVSILSSVFWPDAQINYGTQFSGPLDEFIEWGNAGHARFFDIHQHHVTNINADIDGDRAHVEAYLINFLRARDHQFLDIGGARYIDLFERRGGEWRILAREYLADVRTRGSSTVTALGFPPDGPGTMDRSDLSYRRPLERRPATDPAASAWRR